MKMLRYKRRLNPLEEHWFGWFVCLIATLFYCYEYILRMVPSVMTGELMRHYGIGVVGFGWLTDSYLISYTAMQFFVGPVMDYCGLRKSLLLALISCIVGSILFAYAPSFWFAFIGRFFIGFGSSFAFVGVLRLVSLWLPAHFFSFFSGFTTALGMLGAMLGDIFLVHWVKQTGWASVIYATAMTGVILLPMFFLFVIEKSTPVLIPRRSAKKFLLKVVQVVKNKNIFLPGFIGSFMFSTLCVFADVWGIRFNQNILHLSLFQSGKVNSMLYLGWLIGSPIVGILSEYAQNRKAFLFFGCLGASICFLILLYGGVHSYNQAAFLMLLLGLFSSAEILCFAVGKESVEEGFIASAIGAVNFLVMLGGMILLPLVSHFLSLYWTGVTVDHVKVYSFLGYRNALLIIPIGLLLSALFSLMISPFPRNKRKSGSK